jgi:hypothetical protein
MPDFSERERDKNRVVEVFPASPHPNPLTDGEGAGAGKLPAEDHDRQVGVQIGVVVDAAGGFGVQGDRLVDLDLLVAAELLEVGDGKETDVGRVVPAIALERADPGVRPRPAADRVRERENVSALTRSRPWVIAPRTRTSGGMTG